MIILIGVILLFTYALSLLASLLYGHVEDSIRCQICHCFGNIRCCRRDNDTQNHGNISSLNHIFVPAVWIPMLFLCLGGILLKLVGILPTSRLWISCLLRATVSGNVLPTIIILNSTQLKEYVKRKITQATTPALLCLEVAFTSLMWIRRSTRIMPT